MPNVTNFIPEELLKVTSEVDPIHCTVERWEHGRWRPCGAPATVFYIWDVAGPTIVGRCSGHRLDNYRHLSVHGSHAEAVVELIKRGL